MQRSLIVMFIVLAMSAMQGQSFKYGVTANVHKGSIVGIHDVSKGKWGGGAGVFAQWPLVENDIYDSAWLYFSPQLEFSMQGEIAKPPQGKQDFRHDYISLPLYIKYFMHRGNMKRDVFFFAGPKLEYMIIRKKSGPPSYAMYEPQEQKINKFGYGVSVGAGLRINDQIEGFIRYDRGFSNIYPDYTHYNTYNHLLAVGVNFYLKKDW